MADAATVLLTGLLSGWLLQVTPQVTPACCPLLTSSKSSLQLPKLARTFCLLTCMQAPGI